METNKPNNPDAFAMGFCNEQSHFSQEGMKLRDYFANSAMQGIINSFSPSDSCKDANHIWTAEMAYKFADAMLKEREQDGK